MHRLQYRYVYFRMVFFYHSHIANNDELWNFLYAISSWILRFNQFTYAYVGPFEESDTPQYYKCIFNYLDKLVTGSRDKDLVNAWYKEKPELQVILMEWEACFNRKNKPYVQIIITKYINQFWYYFCSNFRCHRREGVNAVQMISVATHTLKFRNEKIIREFYEKFKGQCKDFRPKPKIRKLPWWLTDRRIIISMI